MRSSIRPKTSGCHAWSRIQPRLIGFRSAAALRAGTLVNQSDLARDVGLPQPTVHRYLNLLETSYLHVRVPAYSVNRTKRLIKAPRLYWGDTGLALFLAGVSEPDGHHLENVVLNDLLVWRDFREVRAGILHWRTTGGEEVEFVIETKESLLPIEVKATTRPTLGDARHIHTFRCESGVRARPGVLLHTGSSAEWLSADALALPWCYVV
jgi:predicted AAA+ superfamily ATPase